MNEIGLFETIYSARAIRHFRPEPIELLTQILEAAIRAPSATNGQHWLFVVVPMAHSGAASATSTAALALRSDRYIWPAAGRPT
jgi:nitroreductase